MKILFPVIFASVYGLIMRLLFGMFGDIMGIMTASFFVIGPLVIGFLTVIFLPRKKVRSNTAAFFLPWLTCLGLLVITIAIELEGAICWVMAYPLFAIVAGLGGLMANKIRKKKDVDIDDIENYVKWTEQDKFSISFIMLLPVICAVIEGERLTGREDIVVNKSIVINANAAQVWDALASVDKMNAGEKRVSLCGILGFPNYTASTQDSFSIGGHRKAIYERGLYFDETITGIEKEKLLVLNIKTDPYHIPPTVMDEHILIGGKHLDMLQDVYHVEKLPGNKCKLSISSHFYINTAFNWYAAIWARFLMNDILSGTLDRVNARVRHQ